MIALWTGAGQASKAARFLAMRESTVEQPAASSAVTSPVTHKALVFMAEIGLLMNCLPGYDTRPPGWFPPGRTFRTTHSPMSRTHTIAIGSDHAGFAYKEAIKAMLLGEGHVVRDFGTYSDASC